MKRIKVLHVAGARPNFMKVAPIIHEMNGYPEVFEQVLVHTGQHYDHCMSDTFFRQLELPVPDDYLGVGAGSHAQQTANVMAAFEPVLFRHRPDWVLVVGDVNSTVASALVCCKTAVKVAHVEAGLRSDDRSMPEEINRIVTDHISDLLFTPSEDANVNLNREGIAASRVRFVGNVMIDSLVRMLPSTCGCAIVGELGIRPHQYALVTLHRPSNVDDPERLDELLTVLSRIGCDIPVVFPVHPRTRQRISPARLSALPKPLRILDPLDYISFLTLMKSATLVITDSGGVQEETTFLEVPCLTIRPNTERPVTVELGTNRLVPSTANLLSETARIIAGDRARGTVPELWDGQTAGRIVRVLAEIEGIQLAARAGASITHIVRSAGEAHLSV